MSDTSDPRALRERIEAAMDTVVAMRDSADAIERRYRKGDSVQNAITVLRLLCHALADLREPLLALVPATPNAPGGDPTVRSELLRGSAIASGASAAGADVHAGAPDRTVRFRAFAALGPKCVTSEVAAEHWPRALVLKLDDVLSYLDATPRVTAGGEKTESKQCPHLWGGREPCPMCNQCCCCRTHMPNGGRCLECPIHGIAPPQAGSGEEGKTSGETGTPAISHAAAPTVPPTPTAPRVEVEGSDENFVRYWIGRVAVDGDARGSDQSLPARPAAG